MTIRAMENTIDIGMRNVIVRRLSKDVCYLGLTSFHIVLDMRTTVAVLRMSGDAGATGHRIDGYMSDRLVHSIITTHQDGSLQTLGSSAKLTLGSGMMYWYEVATWSTSPCPIRLTDF